MNKACSNNIYKIDDRESDFKSFSNEVQEAKTCFNSKTSSKLLTSKSQPIRNLLYRSPRNVRKLARFQTLLRSISFYQDVRKFSQRPGLTKMTRSSLVSSTLGVRGLRTGILGFENCTAQMQCLQWTENERIAFERQKKDAVKVRRTVLSLFPNGKGGTGDRLNYIY